MKCICLSIVIIICSVVYAIGQGSPGDLPSCIKTASQNVVPTTTQNYIVNYTYLEPKSTHSSTYNTGEIAPVISYFDGLGRPCESVSVKASQSGSDLVSFTTYDNYDRLSLQYLPYAKGIDNHGAYVSQTDFVTGQSGFLTQLYGSTDGTKGYTETLYEPSPLNRITMQGAPGEDWQITENPDEFTYITNSSPVSSWRYVGNSTLVSVSYPVGSLFVKEITDEDNNEVKEYIDKLGNMVQQEVGSEKTRYCYDDKGLLRCVLQPGASSPGDVSLCFFFSYDEKRRLIEKLIPGKEPEFYVYDERNRVVLSQDGVLRTANKWQYTIYNSLNQPTVQGIWESSLSRSALASLIKNDINYISKQGGRVPYKYFYYNLYVRRFYIPLHSDAYDLDQVEATNNTGRLTSEKTNLLTSETGMDTCIMITYYYDKYGRLIQTAKDNHLGGKDYITNAYSFTGLVKQTRYRHIVEDNTYTDQYNDYDHRGRVMKIRHTINEGDTVLMAGNNYNEAGELIDTYLHSVSGSAFLQRLDFTYNIRGWLTQINDPASFTENDKFGLNLFYNMAPSGGSSLYNGNISGMEWGTPTNSSMLFRFSYDGLNRLVTADFNKSGYDSYAFDCAYEYYPGGNISVLRRRDSGGAYLDNLSYNYTGNRINYIMDYAGDVPGKVNYPGDEECNAFDYDDNGNVTYEPSRGIQLEYNLLNLPQEIDFNLNHKTNYFYTFNGEKVRRVVESNGTVAKTDYCGPFVHETVNGVDSLKYIITPMGRAVKNGSGWDYEYNLKDQLGNTRVVIHSVNGVAQIIQERHYFPYGMDMSELSSGTSTNKYLYNGKEYENDFDLGWYDYGARFYDAQIGRWSVIDPMIEKHYDYTPYAYVYNNPIRHIDPFGLDTLLINQKSGKVLDVHKGGEDYVYYTRKKKAGDKAWKSSKQLFHALNISGESGGTPSKKGEPVVWSNLKDYTDDFNRALSSVSTYWEAEKYRLEEGQSILPGEKELLRNLYWRNSVDDGKWMDIKRGPYHPSIKGEWSWYNGTLVRYDDYGNMLFGSAGRAFGFSQLWLKTGAFINQAGKGGIDAGKDVFSIKRGYEMYPSIFDVVVKSNK